MTYVRAGSICFVVSILEFIMLSKIFNLQLNYTMIDESIKCVSLKLISVSLVKLCIFSVNYFKEVVDYCFQLFIYLLQINHFLNQNQLYVSNISTSLEHPPLLSGL